jgi:cysteine dioxygenase
MSSTVAYSASVAGSEKPDSLHDSARGTPEPQPAIQDKFQGLVDEINTILEPSNGLDIDIEELQRVMASYESEESEWAQYAFGCEKRPYTRNLVDAGNGRHNLVSEGSEVVAQRNAHVDRLLPFPH